MGICRREKRSKDSFLALVIIVSVYAVVGVPGGKCPMGGRGQRVPPLVGLSCWLCRPDWREVAGHVGCTGHTGWHALQEAGALRECFHLRSSARQHCLMSKTRAGMAALPRNRSRWREEAPAMGA